MNLTPRRAVRTIANLCEGRDNNFNLLRIAAASLVIVTHAFSITGNARVEPLKTIFDISFGSWAVDIFFVASGFLIAKSWDRKKSVSKFIWARIMRIYPALWVCVLICVFVIGVGFTTLPIREFLIHPDTLKFLAKNLTLLKGTFVSLPGTFSYQIGGDTNTSLWTLPYEVKMYLVLLALGWTGWLYKRGVLPVIVVLAFAVHAWCITSGLTETRVTEYSRFIYFFFVGSYFYLQRERIQLRLEVTGVLLVMIAACMFVQEMRYRTITLSITTPYLVMFCAYVPSGFIRAYNRVGDYSYGLYIYGAPIGHVIFATGGSSMPIAEVITWNLGIAGGLAILSWHLLESRALQVALPLGHWRKTRVVYEEANPK